MIYDGANLVVHLLRLKCSMGVREPWSSGYGRRVMFQRSWVRIRLLEGHFFTYLFVVKFVMCVLKDENKLKSVPRVVSLWQGSQSAINYKTKRLIYPSVVNVLDSGKISTELMGPLWPPIPPATTMAVCHPCKMVGIEMSHTTGSLH